MLASEDALSRRTHLPARLLAQRIRVEEVEAQGRELVHAEQPRRVGRDDVHLDVVVLRSVEAYFQLTRRDAAARRRC